MKPTSATRRDLAQHYTETAFLQLQEPQVCAGTPGRCESLSDRVQRATEVWISGYQKGQCSPADLSERLTALLQSYGLLQPLADDCVLPSPRKRANTGRTPRSSLSPMKLAASLKTLRSTNKTAASSPPALQSYSLRECLKALIQSGYRYVQKTDPFVLFSKDTALVQARTTLMLLLTHSAKALAESIPQSDSPQFRSPLETSISRDSLSLSIAGDERRGIQTLIVSAWEDVDSRTVRTAAQLQLHCSKLASLRFKLRTLQKLISRRAADVTHKDYPRVKVYQTLYYKAQKQVIALQHDNTTLKERCAAVLPVETELDRAKSEAASVSVMLSLRERAIEESERLRMTIEDLRERLRGSDENCRKARGGSRVDMEVKLAVCEEKLADVNLQLIRCEATKEVEVMLREREVEELRKTAANVLSISAENRLLMTIEDLRSSIQRTESASAPLRSLTSELQSKVAELEAENSALGNENSFLNKECDDLKYGMSICDTKSILCPETVEKFKATFADLQNRWEESFRHELEMRARIRELIEENEALKRRLSGNV